MILTRSTLVLSLAAVAYTRNTPMAIAEFEPFVDAGEAITGGPNPGPTAFMYRATHDRLGPNETVFKGVYPSIAPAVGSAALPNHIDCEPLYTLDWEVSFTGGVTWFPIGSTNHEVYVTLAAPTGQRLESMYHIAVLEAQGESDTAVARDAIWANFATRLVQRKDGGILGYYRSIACSTNLNGSITASSLLTIDNGQCNAWVELFQGVLGVHGISSQRVQVAPRFTSGGAFCTSRVDAGFLVKNYNYAAASTASCENYPYRFNYPCPNVTISGQQVPVTHWPAPEATDAFGTPGQDEPDPASAFGRHYIVNVSEALWYDPSYGTGPWVHANIDDAAHAWETDSIAGFFSIVGSININGMPHLLLGARPADADIREVVFTIIPE
jgi:hypothetical protein